MNNFKKVLVQAAKKAGAFQLKNFGTIKHRDVKRKLHGEYVTYVDKYSCKLIIGEIKKHYPNHNIVSEELPAIQKGSDYTWYIDPLDGTTNYSINNPLFGVAIAVANKKEVIESVVYLPVLKQLYYAKKNSGTYINGKRVHVSTTNNIHKSIITISFPHNLVAARRAMSIFKEIRPYVANIRISLKILMARRAATRL
jgi:myo-inositol-1(or 4)-monophosphatase